MIVASFVLLIICLGMLIVRFVLGPTNLDRLMCMEAITLVIMSFGALWGLYVGSAYFMDAILVLSIVGFISTVALAKMIEKGQLFND